MKLSTRGLFIIALIVMSFVAVPAALAENSGNTGQGNGPEYKYYGPDGDNGPPDVSEYCTELVEGQVTWVSTVIGQIIVDGETTVNGLPIHLGILVGDWVVINYWISPDGNYVACYLTINGGEVIELRH